jgi:hypothetical protein
MRLGRSERSNQPLRCIAHSVCSLVAIKYLSSPSPGVWTHIQGGGHAGFEWVEDWVRAGGGGVQELRGLL